MVFINILCDVPTFTRFRLYFTQIWPAELVIPVNLITRPNTMVVHFAHDYKRMMHPVSTNTYKHGLGAHIYEGNPAHRVLTHYKHKLAPLISACATKYNRQRCLSVRYIIRKEQESMVLLKEQFICY